MNMHSRNSRPLSLLILSLAAVLLLLSGAVAAATLLPFSRLSGLSYNTATAVYTQGTAITPNSPHQLRRSCNSYSVSPALPGGLSLSTSTGIISGTPTAMTATASYTVTASNSAGSTTASLSIHGGGRGPGGPGLHDRYGGLHRGTTIPPNSPTSSGGTVTSYSVSPALPAGLSLSTTTGSSAAPSRP